VAEEVDPVIAPFPQPAATNAAAVSERSANR